MTEEQRASFEAVKDAFREYCKPIKNDTYERFKFFKRNQMEDEDFEHFLVDIKSQAENCSFGNLKDELIRDKIVSGIRDRSLQERLLRETNLTLVKAEKLCKASEASKTQIKELRNEQEVCFCRHNKRGTFSKRKIDKIDVYNCFKCGKKHGSKNCPAFGKTCNICNRSNHFAVGCKLKNKSSFNSRQGRVCDEVKEKCIS